MGDQAGHQGQVPRAPLELGLPVLWPVLQDRSPWERAWKPLLPHRGCPPGTRPPHPAPPSTYMVLLILQDGGIEGPLLPLLRGQGDLAAEPPGRKDRSGDLRAGQAGAGAPTCSPHPLKSWDWKQERTCWRPPAAAAGALPSSSAAGAAESRPFPSGMYGPQASLSPAGHGPVGWVEEGKS